jgi:ABC-type lipoprotein release transport system permease subunit
VAGNGRLAEGCSRSPESRIGTDVVRGFALLLVVASVCGLFVALPQALDERRYDLAIMRALGASRGKVVAALVPGAGILATLNPAWRAYRQDVAATLPDG